MVEGVVTVEVELVVLDVVVILESEGGEKGLVFKLVTETCIFFQYQN